MQADRHRRTMSSGQAAFGLGGMSGLKLTIQRAGVVSGGLAGMLGTFRTFGTAGGGLLSTLFGGALLLGLSPLARLLRRAGGLPLTRLRRRRPSLALHGLIAGRALLHGWVGARIGDGGPLHGLGLLRRTHRLRLRMHLRRWSDMRRRSDMGRRRGRRALLVVRPGGRGRQAEAAGHDGRQCQAIQASHRIPPFACNPPD
jgi:hypothetical protein